MLGPETAILPSWSGQTLRAQVGVGPVAVTDAREPQFRDEPVLQRAPEALDPSLGLGAASLDGADAELDEGATHLCRHSGLLICRTFGVSPGESRVPETAASDRQESTQQTDP
jgi:hypothetical protein